MYDLNNEFKNDHQLSDISEQLEDFTIDDEEQENYDVTVDTLLPFLVQPSYLNSSDELNDKNHQHVNTQ
ncbi:unnamed protein product [Rhizophagus irregularis]|nr:unnamed protein product [Rhizophagus irregularis]